MTQRRSVHDVAREAGVSIATVSRVLTGSRSVRKESQEAVLAAVEKLGYRPNQVGRALRRQFTQVVGMVVPRVDNPFFPSLIQACEEYLREKSYALLLCTSGDAPDVERDRLQMLVDRQVDGLLVSPCRYADSGPAVTAASAQVPVVELDRRSEGFAGDYVGIDDAHGMQSVVGHLRELGYRDLAFVGSNEDNYSGAARLRAFVGLCGARLSADWVLLGTFSEQWGREAGLRLLRAKRRPDAIVCANDLIGLGVLQAAESLGLQVPADVAVTGYDDIAMAQVSHPRLTTVRQPIEQLAEQAIELLLARMIDPDADGTVRMLRTDLVPRGSTVPRSRL